MATKTAEMGELAIPALKKGLAKLRIVGTSPLYMERMSMKVKAYLLAGGAKKTPAEKRELKHDPEAEYRDSAQTISDGPTALAIRSIALKAAMCAAALETEGVTKTSAERSLTVEGELVPCWGIPRLKMDVVRSADMAKTPDIRTRAYLSRWCAELPVSFITPKFSMTGVFSMLANAGVVIGVGGFRQQKGKGNYGLWRVLETDDDAEWDEIVASGGRQEQIAALANPVAADEETQELLDFLATERAKRSATITPIKRARKVAGEAA